MVAYLHSAEEYKGFTFVITEVGITAYCLNINSGLATVKECIHIDCDLHVQLSYEGVSLPIPGYICKQSGKLHSLDLLTNLPSYCRNATCSYDVDVIKKLLSVFFYSPKGRPKYSSEVLKFALMLRYTSHSAYQFLSKFLPLRCAYYLTMGLLGMILCYFLTRCICSPKFNSLAQLLLGVIIIWRCTEVFLRSW